MEHTKEKWETMPWTRRDGDNIRWVKAVRGKRRVAICQTFSPNAEAHARFIAAAPATARHRDKLVEACTIVQERLAIICADGGSMQDFLNAGSLAEIVEAIAAIEDK